MQRLNSTLNPFTVGEQKVWAKIGFVEGSGVSNEIKNYSFIDSTVKNGYKYAYRLKQIDNNGDYHYSPEIKIDADLEPSNFSLSQNYPNPFNPVTTIDYSVAPENGTNGVVLVQLKAYDVLGREVCILVNERKPAGSYKIEFDGSKLSSGIYYYRLTAGNYSLTKKMILMK